MFLLYHSNRENQCGTELRKAHWSQNDK